MEQRIQQIDQRLNLLKKHTQEWKLNTHFNTQRRNELLSEHYKERREIMNMGNSLKWAILIAGQAEELLNLSLKNSLYLTALKGRQRQEYFDLEEQLEQAQDNSTQTSS